MILSAALALAVSDAWAEPSYRAIELDDGRAFVAEVLATGADGLDVRTPHGRLILPFDALRDMRPTDAEAYEAQPLWQVHVAAPEALRDGLLEALGTVPEVEVHVIGVSAGTLSDATAARATACGLDLDCLVDVLSAEPWRLVVVARPGVDQLHWIGAVSTGTVLYRSDLHHEVPLSPLELEITGHALLGLEFPSAAPRLAAHRERTRSSTRIPFAPLPGLPALQRGDHAAFATALGIAVPATAIWVGAVGRNAQSAPEAVALSLAGFYVSAVLANQLTSSRPRR